MEKQISLFDMELPPQNDVKEISQKELKTNIRDKNNTKAEKINFAKVPDNDPKMNYYQMYFNAVQSQYLINLTKGKPRKEKKHI